MPADTTYRVLALSVSGMHCGACERLITGEARRVDGVAAATADAEAGVLTVYLEREIAPEAFIDAIRVSGFEPGEPLLLSATEADELPGQDNACAHGGPGELAAECSTEACPVIPGASGDARSDRRVRSARHGAALDARLHLRGESA